MSSILLRLLSPQDRSSLGTGDHSSSSAESTDGHRGGGQGEQAACSRPCCWLAPAKTSRQDGISHPTATMGPAAHPEPRARCSIARPRARCRGIRSLRLYEHLNQPVLLRSPSRSGMWAPGKPHILAVTAARHVPNQQQPSMSHILEDVHASFSLPCSPAKPRTLRVPQAVLHICPHLCHASPSLQFFLGSGFIHHLPTPLP